jgi:hypothetical protein
MEIISPQVSVPYAAEAFNEDGSYKDERLRRGMHRLCQTLIERAAMLSQRDEP